MSRRDPALRHRRHRRHRATSTPGRSWPTRGRELVAVTDHVREKAERSPRTRGTRPSTTTSMPCSPPSSPMSSSSARHRARIPRRPSPRSPPGAHVVVEKPPAPSLDELDEMREAARAAGPPARRRLPAAHRHRGGTRQAPARLGGARPAAARRSARPCGSAMPTTSPCPGAASGRPRAAARRWATASISSICSRSCSATGPASRAGCGDSTARRRPRTPRPRRSCSRTEWSRRSSRARSRRARRARSASTRRRRRSRSTTSTATATRTGRSRRRPHVPEDEAARWALPAVEERSDHAPAPARRLRRAARRRAAAADRRRAGAIVRARRGDLRLGRRRRRRRHAGRPRRAPHAPARLREPGDRPAPERAVTADRSRRPGSGALSRPGVRRRDRPDGRARRRRPGGCSTRSGARRIPTPARGRVGARHARSASRAATTASAGRTRGPWNRMPAGLDLRDGAAARTVGGRRTGRPRSSTTVSAGGCTSPRSTASPTRWEGHAAAHRRVRLGRPPLLDPSRPAPAGERPRDRRRGRALPRRALASLVQGRGGRLHDGGRGRRTTSSEWTSSSGTAIGGRPHEGPVRLRARRLVVDAHRRVARAWPCTAPHDAVAWATAGRAGCRHPGLRSGDPADGATDRAARDGRHLRRRRGAALLLHPPVVGRQRTRRRGRAEPSPRARSHVARLRVGRRRPLMRPLLNRLNFSSKPLAKRFSPEVP